MLQIRSLIVMTCAGASLASLTAAAPADGLPTIPGFDVEVFADVVDPMMLSFGPDGMLYVGRDNSGSGGGPGDAVSIHRVTPGGAVTEFGPAIPDPDALVFDPTGIIGSGDSVLVGSLLPSNVGRITEVLASDESAGIVCESPLFLNPSGMVFDRDDRLLFTGNSRSRVFVSEGECPPPELAVAPSPVAIAVDSENRFFVCGIDGVVRSFAPDGTPISDSVAQFAGWAPLEFGPGGAFGTDLYAIDRTAGILYRVTANGPCEVGSGFVMGVGGDLAFGADGSLYIPEFANDRILRVTPSACRADVDGDGQVNFDDLLAILAAWGPCSCCPEDIDADGVVAFDDLLAVLAAWGSCS